VHPWMATATAPLDWDAALVRGIRAVEQAGSDRDYRGAIAGLLTELHDPVTRVAADGAAPQAPDPGPLLARLDVLDEKSATLTIPNDPSLESTPNLRAELCARFSDAARFEALVLDLRSPSGRAPGWAMTDAIAKCTARLLDRDVTLAPARFLTHGFYPMQSVSGGAGGGLGFWESGLQVVSSGSLRSEGAHAPRLVFIVGPGTADLYPLLMALQAHGLAQVVQEGELPEAGVMASTFEAGDGLAIRLRHGEWLRPDGGAGFRADAAVPAGSGDAARQKAVVLLKAPRSAAAAPGPVSQSYEYAAFLEKDYSETPYPDREHRLLALFRLFAVIEHFYPYKGLMDRPWADTLVEFIPRMNAARDATDYALTVTELATRIQDSHVTLASPVLDAYFGTHRPAVRVDLVEGQTVVTEVAPELAPNGLRVGDIVVSVDGEATAARRLRLARYLPASTPGRLENKIDVQFLLGSQGKPAELEVRGEDGAVRRASAPRTLEGLAPRSRPRTGPAYAVLPAGYGYVDLQALTAAQVDAAFEAIKATPGAIFDMRGYPGSGARELIPRLGPPQAHARALGGTPHYDGGSGTFALEEGFWTDDEAEPREKYAGRVVVLADGSSQSAAEYVCQLIKSVVDATVVGSRTSGANGAVTRTVLPGGIVVNFSGQSVRNADGSPLQRVGILPDIPSQPTLAGVRAGRDEVLERAVSFLSKGR
jgi:C-terminal processing protease CtpA/Prc